MKLSTTAACLIGVALTLAAGTSTTWAKPRQQQPQAELSENGKRLESEYRNQLESLQKQIASSLSSLTGQQKADYQNALEAEKAANAAIAAAQGRLDKIKGTNALVGHAKNKWIAGADKGIAQAKAKLEKATTDAERKAAQTELANWEKNRQDGEAALKERTAAMEQAERDRPNAEKELNKAQEELAQAKAGSLKAIQDLGLTALLSSNKLDGILAKHTVLSEATPAGLAAFAQQSGEHEKLVAQLLADEKLMLQMLVADGADGGKYGEAMKIYTEIQKASSKAREGVLQRLALAVALDHAVPNKQRNIENKTDAPEFVNPLNRYLHFEKAFLNNELDPGFKTLSTWDLRMVVDGEEPDEILTWGREFLHNYRPDHITTSDYGWRYVAAVRTDIRYGSQDVPYDQDDLHFFQNILKNGGICGRRAFFGRFILRAFGVPTIARPQHAHAALAHWTPKGWVVCLGGGWGIGWTKTPYDRDLDFLATTQARALGEDFMQVKRAQWIGDAMGEPRSYGFITKNEPAFWNSVSLYTQRALIEGSKTKVLAAVGEDIGEANESKEKEEIAAVMITDDDRKITVDAKGVITIPAAATSNPTQSTGKILFLNSVLGGKQLHYSRNGNHQPFEYTIEAPTAGKYALTARVVTSSWKQSLLLTVNDAKEPVEFPLPFTVGMWAQTQPLVIELAAGTNVLRFSREGDIKGISIRDFTLTPQSGATSMVK